MKKIYQFSLLTLFFFSLSISLFAQNSFFTPKGESAILSSSDLAVGQRVIIPQKYKTVQADMSRLKDFLWSLPAEKNVSNRNTAPIMELPMPDGSMAKFHVWESSVMEPGLAAKFPDMRQFLGQGIDDPYASIRFDYNPYTGFHAQILSAKTGRIYIDPYAKGDMNHYIIYNVKDYTRDVQFICGVIDNDLASKGQTAGVIAAACLGTNLRTYRLALACTGEYAVAVAGAGPTVPAVAAAMLTSVNRVTGVYEKEVSLRMVLVANNNNLIYLNGATDPYTNNNGTTMLGENQANVDAVIGTANYDIGHVFSTGGGGVANLNSPCNAGTKARGVTGLPNPVGDAFDIDYVAHEMGHQWGGNHSMAGCGSSPASTKYEVGGGTTIQAYAGICGAQDIQPNSDPYFHGISFDEISNYITTGGGSTCGVSTATGNTLPVINALPNNNLTIPPSTPFTLSGTATDGNGDPLTYSWEGWDLQGTQNWNAGATAAAGNTVPLFKSRIPKTTGVRTFPDIAVILAGYPANPPVVMGGLKGETLSPVARAMNFRLTVRDNRAGGGGVVSSGGAGCQTSTPFVVNVAGTSGPFAVTVPNGGESYTGGSTQTVTWNPVGTTAAPYNVANVMISLSTDGGLTYPTVLLASTPNDGTQSVTIPTGATTTARIKVEAVGNVFFDISNANFSITGGTATNPTVTINQAAAQPDPTSVSPINFTVVFDQAVTGFATGDVTLTGTAGGTLTGVVTGGPITYNVAVAGMTTSGTVIATIPAGVCQNAALEANLASTSTDNTVTWNSATVCATFTGSLAAGDATLPARLFRGGVVSSCAVPSPFPGTSAVTVFYDTYTYTNNTGLTQCGTFTLTTTDLVNANIQHGIWDGSFVPANQATNYLGDPGLSTGTPQTAPLVFTRTINAGQTIVLVVWSANASTGASGTASNYTLTVEFPTCAVAANPNVTINQAVGQGDPTSTAPINFTAVFDQPVINFATGDVTLSGTAGATTATVSGGPSTYNIAVTGMSTNGTVIATIAAGVCTNAALMPNNASTSTDNTVTFSTTCIGPIMNTPPNQAVCAGVLTAPVNFTSNTAGTIYNWTNSNPAIGLGASGTGNIASFIATNPGATPITGTITVTPSIFTSGGPCTGLPPQTFTNNTPIAIPTGPAVVTSSIVVAGAPAFLLDLNMQTFITHTFNSDLDITITSPAGTVVTLTSDNGAGNDNVFNGTIWDDNANPGGQVPYTTNNGMVTDHAYANLTLASPLTPEEAFGAFIGENPNGTWTLTVSDDAAGDGGSLDSWSLIISGLAAPPALASSSFSNTTPVAIPTGPGVITSTINVTGAGTQLFDVNLTTFITHTFNADLDITITSPAGTVVTLTSDNGAGNDDVFNGTIWDDDANPGGQVPYTTNNGMVTDHAYVNLTLASPLTPEEALAAFIGEDPNGTWTLTISDDLAGDGGSLNSWSLNLQTSTCGSLCSGPPVSFTITVNPNPSIVIVADPGTTICEGDPTLLTVVTGTASTPGPLYNQTGAQVNGSPSQVFEPANAAFDSQAADDFTVPAGATWSVTGITANGIGTGIPTSVNVFFYSNTANLPGTAIASFNNITTFTQAGANYTVTLPTAVNLTAGTYWMSFQVNMSFTTGGQWFWGNFGTTNIGNEYAWRNPGGGFATPCTNWGYGGTGCNVGGGPVNRNNIFSIVGTSITGGGPLPGGYTFLWSPALGLSSTTSNPVAASPMNTTTYTVVATGPGPTFCSRTASITITVNKRPVVTTHPVSRANCVGTTATFTVAGTGTGLTYQWQESPTGCAGTWTNLSNGGIYSGVNTATLSVGPVTQAMNGYAYRAVLGGACAPWTPPTNVSNCAVLTVNANPVVAITPVMSCGGVAGLSGTLLSVGSSAPPVPGSVTVSSGTINLQVPDNTANGVSNVIAMAGVPANATITNVAVTFNNFSHTYPGDMIIHLQAPNGQILNLYKYGTGVFTGPASGVPTWGWYGSRVSQLGTTAWSTVATAPFIYNNTTNWRADAINTPVAGAVVQNPTGFVSNAPNFAALYTTPASTTGNWTLAMADGGPGDVGTLASWSLTIEYTTPGGGGGPALDYVWSPLTGLYNNATTTSPYTGTSTPSVYAAPTVFTVYTVTATDPATGCFSSANAYVNYTPPAPTVTPSSVAMCLGDPAVRLIASSSTTTTSTVTASSGAISVAIPDGSGAPAISDLTIAGVPAGATITDIRVTMNISHTWVGDMDVNLRAPNNAILNLVGSLDGGLGGNGTDNFTGTVFSSAGGAPISGAPAPRTGIFAAEARAGYGPTGYIQTVPNWAGLTPTSSDANGTWRLAMGDWFPADPGTLTSWSIAVTSSVTVGVPSTPATWSPIGGLYNDAAATIPYTGTPRDTVWTRPAPSGVYTYQVTVQSLPVPPISFSNTAPITINASGNGTPYPANLTVSGLPTAGVSVRSVTISGITHTWAEDVDIVLQSPTGQNVILISDISAGGADYTGQTYTLDDAAATTLATVPPPPSGTYRPTNLVGAIGPEPDNWPAPGPGAVTQPIPTLASFTGNMNGVWRLFVFDDAGGDAGSITGGFSVNFGMNGVPACTSPARTVVVTVNQPTTVTTQPVNQTVCTDKVATFSVVPAGSGPFTYQWQVSTNSGNPPWTNVNNGGVYSGATTSTLTITAPPVSMNGYFYRVIINGAAPCAAVTSNMAMLTVNPLPVVVISANRTTLVPGLTATLTSTVSPVAAATYTWLRNGGVLTSSSPGVVSGIGTGTLVVDIDGLGDYQLRVNDVNTCTNVSNIITIRDSASGRCFIYPNPTSGKFQVRYYSVANNVLPRTLTVYDAKGDRVFTQFYTIGRPYDRMDVDMRAYGKGLYWVEIGDRNGNRITMCRVVIQ